MAETYYRQAVKIDRQFAVAWNNLGHLYLEEADRWMSVLDSSAPDGETGSARDDALSKISIYLADAEECCTRAMNADRGYQHAYDNLGNVCLRRFDLTLQGLSGKQDDGLLEAAERWFHFAVGLDPEYGAAFQDIALVSLRRSQWSNTEMDACTFYMRDSLSHHAKAVKAAGGLYCDDYGDEALEAGVDVREIAFGPDNDGVLKELKDAGCTCIRD